MERSDGAGCGGRKGKLTRRPDRRFWYRLALALGYATVEELQERVDATQFAEWRAYYELEPFGQDRGDIPAAIIAREVARQLSGKEVPLEAFIPTFEPPKKATGEEMLAKARAFVGRFKALGKKR